MQTAGIGLPYLQHTNYLYCDLVLETCTERPSYKVRVLGSRGLENPKP